MSEIQGDKLTISSNLQTWSEIKTIFAQINKYSIYVKQGKNGVVVRFEIIWLLAITFIS